RAGEHTSRNGRVGDGEGPGTPHRREGAAWTDRHRPFRGSEEAGQLTSGKRSLRGEQEGSMEWWQELLAIVRLDQVALAGIVTWGVVMLVSGRLHPNSTVVDLRKERGDWKQAYLNEARAGAVKDGQISELMEVARAAQSMYRSLPGGDVN